MKFHLFAFVRLSLISLAAFGTSFGQSQLVDHDFRIIHYDPQASSDGTGYYETVLRGTERKNNSLNRLSMPTEDQLEYPEPASGCGPTAMLNILIWYEKYGLIEPYARNADSVRYKQAFFREIDQRLSQQTGTRRDQRNGTRAADAAIVMDALVHELSGGKLRIHTDYQSAPIPLKDFLGVMPNFRSGYLVVYPKDPRTGKRLGLHAVSLLRADRAGYLSLGTWGQVYRGILKKRGDEQWFIPQDPDQLELQILQLIRFIPFAPSEPQ